MKKTSLFILVFLLTLILPAMAGGLKVITLKDGSSINGHIVGISNGRYVVENPSVGEVSIKEDDVVTISSAGETLPPAAGSSAASPSTYGNPGAGASPTNPYAG